MNILVWFLSSFKKKVVAVLVVVEVVVLLVVLFDSLSLKFVLLKNPMIQEY